MDLQSLQKSLCEAIKQDCHPAKEIMPSKKCHLLCLPAELRLMIYGHLFSDHDPVTSIYKYSRLDAYPWMYQLKPGLLRTCGLIRHEAMDTCKARLLAIWKDHFNRLTLTMNESTLWHRQIDEWVATTTADVSATHRLAWLIRAELRMMHRQGFILSLHESEQINQQFLDFEREYFKVLFLVPGDFREAVFKERRRLPIIYLRTHSAWLVSHSDLRVYPATCAERHRVNFLFTREHPRLKRDSRGTIQFPLETSYGT